MTAYRQYCELAALVCLRIYSAWLSEADQRAAGTLADRMPALPAGVAMAGRRTRRW